MSVALRLGVAAALAASPALADLGEPWCDADGARMWIDADVGVWFNEHTRCAADPLPPADIPDLWQARLDCVNIYVTEVHDDGTVETEEIVQSDLEAIRVTRAEPNRLTVELSGAPAFDMIHCHSQWPN